MMFTYRRANIHDVPAVVELAVESVMNNPLPVKVDREAMADTVRFCLNPAHFGWVTEHEGKVVAAVGACSQASFWYRGQQVSVLLYYSRVPRAGLRLMREFASWCKGRSNVKTAVIEFEPTVDPRLVQYMKRLGFSRESVNLTYVREVTQ